MKIIKTTSRKEKAVETRKKIYETAEQLFKDYGFENITVDSITEKAGVSKGAFYTHFDSKDSLISAMFTEYVNKLDLDYISYLESFPADTAASDIIISLIGQISDIITGSLGYDNMKAIYKTQITKTINTDAILGYNRELYKIFSNTISKGVQQGDISTSLSVDTLAKHFIMAIRGLIYEWCIRYPGFNLKEQALEHFEILMIGFKKR